MALLLIAGSIASGQAAASPDANGPALRLRTGLVDTGSPLDRPSRANRAIQAAEQSRRLVIQLDGPMTPARRAELTAAGVVLRGYLPTHAYIIDPDPAAIEGLDALEFIRWVGPYRKEWKLDPGIGRRGFSTPERQAQVDRGSVQVVITLFDGEGIVPAIDAVEGVGARVANTALIGSQWMIDATIAATDLTDLMDIAAVQFVEEAPEIVPRNNTNEWIVQSNIPDYTPLWNAGLSGQGQIAGLIDWTIDVDHCMFLDSAPIGPDHRKIVAMRNPGTVNFHGTHTAGTLAGNEGPFVNPHQYDGIARDAKISFSNAADIYVNTSTFYDRLVDAHLDGARVHSNSWGDDSTGAYTTWCRQIDQFSYDYEDSMVVFAVTNQPILRSPENAKNVLAVGASQDAPNQDFHCSGGFGPTLDGRRKPEVYAPGCATRSARVSTSCGTSGLTGTSMACPAVAGAGVLMRQYFTDGYYPSGSPQAERDFIPSGALIKAALIHSAVDMTGIGGYPSHLEGWGRVQLNKAVYLLEGASLLVKDVWNADGLSTGQSVSYSFDLASDAVPLSVTLVYTEPPAQVNAAFASINNLDLQVDGPGGATFKGNHFVGGRSATGGSFDDRNNVERVLIDPPSLGAYTVTVTGTAVNVGTQGFALVVTGIPAVQGLDCVYDWNFEQDDLSMFYGCLTGPADLAKPGCECADATYNGRVDLYDFAILQTEFPEW
ncbi:MAG: S8 family serine peptidase [bacterium]|nr:S8 family serine peptidase [bacterium]